ncbi:MAG TPA: RNA-binding cell elongation regulator Jag/EloR [Desulfatiglandales bacterium]|nr:RNA-binding cell elongation regulator Jag/EloR [Desulfatiglandales bacterium]
METYEFEGKTTEEAIQNAARELNLPVEELSVDVIEPGSAGIFGLVGGRKAKIKVTLKTPSELEEEGEEEEQEPRERREEPQENDVSFAKRTLEEILALIPVEATVAASRGEGRITLKVQGDRSGLLIGRKGKTLDALQFLVNKIVTKALDKKIDVVIDSENYRRRREDSLTQLALKMGDKAKRIKKPVTTNPMNPHDRRLIHLALKDDEHLETRSRGEGLLKRVVIIPKGKGQPANKE